MPAKILPFPRTTTKPDNELVNTTQETKLAYLAFGVCVGYVLALTAVWVFVRK